MSFIAEELERQMQTYGLDQTTVASKAGMSQGQISKWRNNIQTTIDASQMRALQTALSKDSLDHAALICAHLRDEIFGLATELVRVEINSPGVLQDRPARFTKGERAVHYLAELRIKSRDTNDLLIDLARCLGADL